MYSMKEACQQTGMTYENLKFYCNEGLVPNVKRDSRNYRIFDEHDIKWINSLNCLKGCGMSITEMKEYLALCLQGESSIPKRKVILEKKKEALLASIEELQTKYYIRFVVADRPGVLAAAADIFSKHDVSVRTVTQRGTASRDDVDLVFVTHTAEERNVRAAIDGIMALEGVVTGGAPSVIRVQG